jgi:hypothetical protein
MNEEEIIELTVEGIIPRRLCVRLEIVAESNKPQVFVIRQCSFFVEGSLRFCPAVERNAFCLGEYKYVRQIIQMISVWVIATHRLYIHMAFISRILLKL